MSKEAAMAIATGTPAPTPIEPVKGSNDQPDIQAQPSTPAQASDNERVQALIRKEVRLVKEQELIKKERAEWESKVKKAEELIARDQLFDETKKKDTIGALKMLGFNDNEIFNALAASAPQEKTPEEIARMAAQEEIKKENDKRALADKEREDKRSADLIANFRKDISQTIDKNSDEYEYCKFNGQFAEELIFENVADILKTSKEPITPAQAKLQALKEVESYFEDKAKEMDNLKKRKPAAPLEPTQVEKVAEVKGQPQPVGKPKTLTNNVRATVASTATKKESAEEKRTRLENALRQGVHPAQLRA